MPWTPEPGKKTTTDGEEKRMARAIRFFIVIGRYTRLETARCVYSAVTAMMLVAKIVA
jgi:hypothetical protein